MVKLNPTCLHLLRRAWPHGKSLQRCPASPPWLAHASRGPVSQTPYPFRQTPLRQASVGAVRLIRDGRLRRPRKQDAAEDVDGQLLLSLGLLEGLILIGGGEFDRRWRGQLGRSTIPRSSRSWTALLGVSEANEPIGAGGSAQRRSNLARIRAAGSSRAC
jgi:hypothetical protein